MKIVIGLGNPGDKYVGTRHNVGFDVLAELGKRWGFSRPKSRFEAELPRLPVGLKSSCMPQDHDHLARFCRKAGTMPPKSTYFYPKLLSGLVLNSLD